MHKTEFPINAGALMVKLSAAAAVFLAACLLAVPGQAFYPETEALADRIQGRVGQVESLQVELSLPEAPRLKIAVWKSGRQWRQEWIVQKESGLKVAAAALGRGKSLRDVYPDQERFPLPFSVFWYQAPVQEWWSRLGIDTEIKSYQFVSGQPCLVLGAEYKEWHSPQMWIHNQEVYPVRLFTRRGMIWHWKDYRSVGNHPVPHGLEITFPDGRLIRFELDWRGINVDLPERLFDEQAFAEKFGRAAWSSPDIPLYDFLMSNLPAAGSTRSFNGE